MTFNNNFSELLLLANQDIKFQNENKEEFIFKPIKVKDAFFNENLLWLISFLEKDPKDLNQGIEGFEITDHYDFVLLALTLGEYREEMKEFYHIITSSLKVILPEFNFSGKQMFIDDIPLTKDLFKQITEILFRMLEKEKIVIYDSDDEFTKREKEAKLKVQRIKQNSKKSSNKDTKLEDVFAAIIYEFPQYKLEDLFELNIYNFYYLFKYVGKIANYEVSKIAAGNGLAKKHKYFIEK